MSFYQFYIRSSRTLLAFYTAVEKNIIFLQFFASGGISTSSSSSDAPVERRSISGEITKYFWLEENPISSSQRKEKRISLEWKLQLLRIENGILRTPVSLPAMSRINNSNPFHISAVIYGNFKLCNEKFPIKVRIR